jgi:hypothetical protein
MPLQSLSLVDVQSRGRGTHLHMPALQVGVGPEQGIPVTSWPAVVHVCGALLEQLTGPGVPTQAMALAVVHAYLPHPPHVPPAAAPAGPVTAPHPPHALAPGSEQVTDVLLAAHTLVPHLPHGAFTVPVMAPQPPHALAPGSEHVSAVLLAAQANFPQVPQAAPTVPVTGPQPPQALSPGSEQVTVVLAAEHAYVPHAPQVPPGAPTSVPHPPQAFSVASQPRLPLPAQCPNPAAHELAGIWQTPATHWTGAPALTWGRAAQLLLQVPQLSGSLCVSTHFAPQRVGAGAAQLEAQVGAPVVVEHSPVGAAHALPH